MGYANREFGDATSRHGHANVVELFRRADEDAIDPLADEDVLAVCRDWFTRGDLTPSGVSTDKVMNLSYQDKLDYGCFSPILLVRSPCSFETHTTIYLRFLLDGRLPRICQYAFCAKINKRKLTRKFASELMGFAGKTLEEMSGRSNDDCIDQLIEDELLTDTDGELHCTRKLGYFQIEVIAFLCNRYLNFGNESVTTLNKLWQSDGTAKWICPSSAWSN